MNAIYFYRIGNSIYRRFNSFPDVFKIIIFFLFNSIILSSIEIGKKSRFAYGGIGVVIHSKAQIGERVIIGQNVTIGRKLDPCRIPKVGNNVYIAAGVRILGDMTIGDNVIIGANSVVIQDVPQNTVVAGIPSKKVRTIDCNIYDLLKDIY